jgi:hypothetical protein
VHIHIILHANACGHVDKKTLQTEAAPRAAELRDNPPPSAFITDPVKYGFPVVEDDSKLLHHNHLAAYDAGRRRFFQQQMQVLMLRLTNSLIHLEIPFDCGA